ncbi:GNAT family N-acetyltransferase [Nocardioides sp. TF02-7]|uniref:GNAT family N-acetyltransferase n=1 Tax=Nocardioides sp. TF02-7 TaxID=2917724 RepID=UPI001F055D24|nr:GNAT family N-acetyltransferase [Nocardioides sp. TF02-7]UMG94396.1 GNAT family N-acetyltransferase [Nocardioides sp. TF02-7]
MRTTVDRVAPPATSTSPSQTPTVRHLWPGDDGAVADLVAGCSERCLRDRFFGHVADPAAVLVGLVREAVWEGCAAGAFVDGRREPSLVAVAVALPDRAGRTWELGVLVRDDWQGRGVGARLLDLVLAEASVAGVTPVAVVEAANGRALRLVSRLGRTAVGAALLVEVC